MRYWEALLLRDKELRDNLYPLSQKELPDFRKTSESALRSEDVRAENRVIALDNEMVRTASGLELSRISAVNLAGEVLIDQLVRPDREILNYNTQWSGMTEELLRDVKKRLVDVQYELLQFVNAQTILVGHSLENDLLALKLIHRRVVDTSVLFKQGERKISLKQLVYRHLNKRVIQEGAHDSIEDARSALALAKAAIAMLRDPSACNLEGLLAPRVELDALRSLVEGQRRSVAVVDEAPAANLLLPYGVHFEECAGAKSNNPESNTAEGENQFCKTQNTVIQRVQQVQRWLARDHRQSRLPDIICTRGTLKGGEAALTHFDARIRALYESSPSNTCFAVSFESANDDIYGGDQEQQAQITPKKNLSNPQVANWQMTNPFILFFNK